MEENNKIIRKKIFDNLLVAVAIMVFFIVINFAYIKLEQSLLLNIIKLSSLMVLFLSIGIFEIAYNKDSGRIALYGIEVLLFAIHLLTIFHIVVRFKLTIGSYLVFSAYGFSIYYLFKSILIYTNERKKYLNSLSDIHEIVSNIPEKKEAKKRENKENT